MSDSALSRALRTIEEKDRTIVTLSMALNDMTERHAYLDTENDRPHEEADEALARLNEMTLERDALLKERETGGKGRRK